VDDLGDAYELLDAGDGRRLERFGDVVIDRPAPGAVGPRLAPGQWPQAVARYERGSAADAGRWEPVALATEWQMEVDGLRLELRLTPSGQVGFFPEHLAVARWAARHASAVGAERGRVAVVLNLFAHTGLATLLLARAGAAISHVDASRPAVAWARRNAALSGMEERPVRWLVDDAAGFVAREVRRARRYDGVVLDPPSFGRAPGGAGWSLEAGLPSLLRSVRGLLVGPDAFVACTAHSAGLGRDDLESAVVDGLGLRRGATEVRDLTLQARSGARLASGWAVLVDAVGTEPRQ
jgi:23S rRNA (cytosine1962-C5)-methyltransferase